MTPYRYSPLGSRGNSPMARSPLGMTPRAKTARLAWGLAVVASLLSCISLASSVITMHQAGGWKSAARHRRSIVLKSFLLAGDGGSKLLYQAK